MRKIKFLIGILFLCLFQQAHAQLLHNNTGYFIDYGANNNNTGAGLWYPYSNRHFTSNDSSSIRTESSDALVFEGVNILPSSQLCDYLGFVQNRLWGYPKNYPGYTINMSRPENMAMKIRMKSSGNIRIKKAYIKLMDTLGNSTLCSECIFIISPTSEYEEYEFNFSGKWRDIRGMSNNNIVDSSAISGFDFYFELETPTTDLTGLKVEIDYIQIGSYVNWSYNKIKGHVYNDKNGDCTFNTNDSPVKKGLVLAQPGSYYAYTDANGYYELKVDTLQTSYNVQYLPTPTEISLIEQSCPASGEYTVATPKGKMEYCCKDFAFKTKQCAVLKIDINSTRRRRCFKSTTTVNYQNTGNINSRSAEIKVVYPEYVKPISSVPAWTRKNGDTLYYAVGVLPAYSYNTISIIDSVVCGIEDIRFLTQCTQATISPGNTCIYTPVDWDNADVIVKGVCDNGIAKFKILNEGDGDMADSTRYRVYANDTLISSHKFALKSLEYFNIELPTHGKVIRLEADQVKNHPDFNTIPRFTFEGCVSSQELLKTAFKGIAMNVPQNNDFVTSTSCMQITDSYDPNDKAVFPKGVSDANYISAGTKLNYKIRFENTGTDDAYTVVVVDTLDMDLDATTFLAGSASHPYSIERSVVNGKEVVKFRFNDINLTPKKIDSIKAQGFITFSISAKNDLADGMVIENVAGIFFDYNSAIITNTVSQTIGEYVEEDLAQGNTIVRTAVAAVTTGVKSQAKVNLITIYPNPTNENITVKFLIGTGNAHLDIYSINGVLVLSKDISSVNETSISLHQLKQGVYYYKVSDATGLNENGKIIKQ